MLDEFVIHSATGRPMITVRRDGAKVALSVRASRNGKRVTITTEEADALAAALTRRWPMCGSPSADALSSGDWRPASSDALVASTS
jgi:hypothetical protein